MQSQEIGGLHEFASALAPLLPGLDVKASVNVTCHALHLHMGEVYVHPDAYRLVVGVPPGPGEEVTDLQRARILSLLSDAKQVMRPDGIGYFEHWQIGQHATTQQAMLYRFAIFESSHLGGNWLITESVI